MKHIYFTLITLLMSSFSFGQVIWENDFETWTDDNSPDGWIGVRTSLEVDSIEQSSNGATFGSFLAKVTNLESSHKRFTTEQILLEEGETYEVEVWLKGSADVRTGLYDGLSAGGANGYQNYGAYETVNSTDVMSFVQLISPDTTNAECEVIISFRNGVVEIDKVEIRIGDALVPVAKTIAEIQETTDPTGDSPELGVLVITSGVVTAVAGNGYWIQDGEGAWSGIRVFDTENTPSLGDELSVTGLVEENFENTRLSDIEAYSVLGQTTVPAPTQQAPGSLNSEAFESVLVVSEGLCTELFEFGEWGLTEDPDTIRVDDFLYDAMPTVGVNYQVTGPLEYSFGHFKILPRDANDVEVLSSIEELATLQITTYPNPATDFIVIERPSVVALQFSLYNATGQLVLNEQITSQLERVNVSTLAAGQYTMVISDGVTRAGTLVQITR